MWVNLVKNKANDFSLEYVKIRRKVYNMQKITASFIMSFIFFIFGCYTCTEAPCGSRDVVDTYDVTNNTTGSKDVELPQSTNIRIYYNIPLSYNIQDHIRETCERYDVDTGDVVSIMKIESGFEHNTKTKNNISGGYSIGIMQLNNNYASWYREITGIDNFDINNIYHNIEGGISVYSNYRGYWKERGFVGCELTIRGLNSYNMGIAGFEDYVKKTGSISRSYDRRVLSYKEEELECLEVINIENY